MACSAGRQVWLAWLLVPIFGKCPSRRGIAPWADVYHGCQTYRLPEWPGHVKMCLSGEVSERLKEPVSKTGVASASPWVRIPPSPLSCIAHRLVGWYGTGVYVRPPQCRLLARACHRHRVASRPIALIRARVGAVSGGGVVAVGRAPLARR